MMLKTGENSDFWSPVDVSKFEDSDELSIDIDSLFAILSEPPEDSPSRSEDTSCKNSSQGEATSAVVNHKRSSQRLDDIQESKQSSSTGVGLPESSLLYSSEYSTPPDSREGMGSDCWVECQENPGMIFDHGQPPHVDSCSASLVDWTTVSNTKYVPYYREGVRGSLSAPLYCNTDGKTIPNDIPTCRTTFNLKSETEDEEFRLISENCSTAMGSSTEGMGSLERSPCESLSNASNQLSDILRETGGYCRTVAGYGPFADSSTQFPFGTFNLPQKTSVGEEMNCAKDELFVSHIIGSSFKREASAHFSLSRTNSSHDADDGPLTDNKSKQLLCGIQLIGPCKKEVVCIDDARENELLASKTAYYHSVNAKDKAVRGYPPSVSGTSSCGSDSGPLTDCASRRLLLGNPSLTSSEKLTVKDERKDTYLPSWSVIYNSVKVTGEVVKDNSSVYRSHVVDDDDSDVCIIEDISDPRYPPPIVAHGNSLVTSQHSAFGDPLYHTGARLKTNDERLTVQVLLQDLSQTKSEAIPPDFLAVPLLRHQRIALSWMVQKETAIFPCSGGILADDQGMGKTISVIALILKERPPLSKMSSIAVKQDESEALNLDEDDDDDSTVLQLDGMKQYRDFGNVTLNRSSMESENASMLAKGRPAAGTLVVCPTSVLRQWAEELCTKVMKEANLSILVYHGSGRTKDPFELAKYDVVLTTYAIVSQEVPKQPLVDKDDNDKGVSEDHGLGPMELSSSRKRKYPPSSDKKRKKGMDSVLLESAARPLARVGWFRVVLDEAQSIKNFKTQAARACWGLRAKRRWCLSGTPIQNAVDDLYSYFRFLRYDPYAVYKSFCYMIKVPINRNPTNGYRKLQAVLKTIMLRRTKGTRLDGEPIINLPPKTIELKKVDFSMEERDFYSKLEADSRAQFKVYAAAGTVKQNYVNILLMLLRLRQACDHPFLVKGYDSNSVWRSSIEMANKLPREQQIGLLNHLEASLEVCGICSDPPEDAVVTICGHVFCNQCICEHLTSDDNLCPATQCKGQLSVTSVFSRATLKSSLSDETGQASSAVNSASHLVETLKPCSEGLSDSSKIKAALELLQSLSKPLDCTSKDSTLKSIAEVEIHTERGLDDLSKKLVDKAIVFSQWTRMLDLLEARLKNSSIQYRRLDGTMSVVARDKAVKDFNTLPEVTVMIMSLKAASLGLNMVAACHVLLLDLWWNPTTEDQAIDRAHRIGQTRPVTVLRLTVKDTVEDRILALQQKKREMVASAFGEDGSGSRQAHLTEDDLKYLFMV